MIEADEDVEVAVLGGADAVAVFLHVRLPGLPFAEGELEEVEPPASRATWRPLLTESRQAMSASKIACAGSEPFVAASIRAAAIRCSARPCARVVS